MPSPQRHLSIDELSHRASTGLAVRRGEIKISDPIPSSYIHNGAEMDGAYEQPQATPRPEGTWPRRSTADALQGKNDSLTQPVHVSRFTERTSMGPSLATSNMSLTPSKDSVLQRKNTGLRASIKRMFGSKKERNATTQQRSPFQIGSGRIVSMTTPQRTQGYPSSSMQHSLISPSRALHSHAPSPHLRVESENIIREDIDAGQLGRRRNTVPSLLMIPTEKRVPAQVEETKEQNEKQPMSPRPATAIRRNTPPPMQLKRRSRSADTLAELLNSPKAKSAHRRDRSEEIAYWRKSVVIDPLPDLPNIGETLPKQLDQVEKLLSATPSHRPRPSLEPVQDFDFGLNNAANTSRSNTLQERVTTLEVKLFDFEYALAKLQGAEVTKPRLPKIPKRKSLQDLFPESGGSSAQESSSNDLSYLSSSSERWQPPTPREYPRPDRTSKATTVKPSHRRMPSSRSQASSPSSIHLSRDQYDTLRNLIHDEKCARQQLEMQMMNLQKEVDILKSPVYAYVRPTKYPTPSPDESFNDPPIMGTPRMLHRSPHLPPHHDLNETSRFSMTETETEPDTEDASPDVYETPQENIFQFETRTTYSSGMI